MEAIYRRFQLDEAGAKLTYKPGCWACLSRVARVAGQVPEVEVTPSEAEIFDSLPSFDLKSLATAQANALEAGRLYAVERGMAESGTRADAVRHAYWNALMVRAVGVETAAALATAHEAVIGNFPADEAMDLWNNLQGRAIAASHPGATSEELLGLVVQAVESGQMVVVLNAGSLAWSNDFVGVYLSRAETGPTGVHDEYSHRSYEVSAT